MDTPARIDWTTRLSGRDKGLILFGVLLALFLSALDQTIVATALPRILADLNGLSLYGWVSTAYLLGSTAVVPVLGKVGDLYGRKRVVMVGIVVFLVGSALCGTARSMLMLVVFRALQGLGAAGLTSTAFAVPADLFVPAERAKYQGIFGAVFGLSSVVGPLVGGLLTDSLGWRWVFYVNVPVGVVALVFLALRMPKLDSGLPAKIDGLGAALLTLFSVPFLLGFTLSGKSVPVGLRVALFAVAAVALTSFVLWERRVEAPILPPALFRIRTFALLAPGSMVFGVAFFAVLLFLPVFLVRVLGVSITRAGTTLIPLTLTMVVSSVLTGQLVQRTGRYKVAMVTGVALVVVAYFFLSRLGVGSTMGDIRWRMVLLGLGLGPVMPNLTLALQNAVPTREVGVATASRQFFQQLGGAIGAALFGVLLFTGLQQGLPEEAERAQLPADVVSKLDVHSLGGNGPRGAPSKGMEALTAKARANLHADYDAQRALLERAITKGDPEAGAELAALPRVPSSLRQMLLAGGPSAMADARVNRVAAPLREGRFEQLAEASKSPVLSAELQTRVRELGEHPPAPGPARTAAVTALLTQVDALRNPERERIATQARVDAERSIARAEQTELASAGQLEGKVNEAIRRAFARAVVRIFQVATGFAFLAWLLVLFVPPLPLRRNNRDAPGGAEGAP